MTSSASTRARNWPGGTGPRPCSGRAPDRTASRSGSRTAAGASRGRRPGMSCPGRRRPDAGHLDACPGQLAFDVVPIGRGQAGAYSRSMASTEVAGVGSGSAVRLRGLTRAFGNKVAVAGVDLDVPDGSFFGLVGPNGAGKTTLLSMTTGLLRPDSG